MAPIIALMLFMGLFPRPLISRIEPSVTAMLARTNIAQARLDQERRLATHAPTVRLSTREPEIAAAAP
jgi:hypothetical protein